MLRKPHRQSAHQRICKLSSWDQEISSAQENPEQLNITWIHTGLCAWHESHAGKADSQNKIGDGDLLKKAKKLWAVVKYSWLSNKFLSSWEAILGKNRTEHNKAAMLTWLVVSPLLSRLQVFVRMLSRPKDFMTNSEQTFAGPHEEVWICYKIKFAGLNWNCNDRSWRSKLNGKY